MDKSLLIHKYFKNSLSENEEITFNTLLNEDKDFQKAFKEHQSLHRAFEINEAERLKDKLISHDNQKSSTPISSSKSIFFAIAASILIILGTSFYFNFFQKDLYNQYFETYPNVYQPVVRGNTEESSKAFMYYENQDYTKAKEAFNDLLKDHNNPNIRFYYALSFLNTNQPQPAIEEFKKLQNIKFEFQAEVLWYRALAEIKLEQYDKAKALLQTLKDKGFDFKTEEVEVLLEDL